MEQWRVPRMCTPSTLTPTASQMGKPLDDLTENIRPKLDFAVFDSISVTDIDKADDIEMGMGSMIHKKTTRSAPVLIQMR